MKKNILIIILLLPILIYAEYLPQNKVIKLLSSITANDYPEANVVNIDNTIVKLDKKALGTFDEEKYRKILNQAGKNQNKIYFSYDINYDSLWVEEIKIFKTNGKIISLNPKDIMIKTDINSGFSNIYSYSSKLLVGTLPDLEIGDIIYTKAKTRIFKTAIDNYFANRFEIEDYDKYIHKYMEINIPSSIKLYIHDINNKGFKYEKTVAQKGDKTIYRFTVKDAPMIIYEPNMDIYNLIAHHIMITSISDWKEISRWYYNLVEKHLKTDDDIKNKVAELTNGLKTKKEKLQKLFYWVAKKIRYLGVDKEKDRPGLEPHDVTFTFHTRGGVCRDKAALLVAMLREAGINSDVILVSVGNILDKVAPVTWFNHAIVMAYDENGNPEYFLDPTDENTKDFLPAYEEDCSYLVASEKGNTLGIVPVSKPDKNKLLLTIENNINNDNSSQTSMHFTFIGLFDDFLRNRFVRYTKQDYDEFFANLAEKFNPAAELTDYSYTNPNDKSKNISFTLKLNIPSYVSSSKSYYFIPFDITNLDKLSLSIYKYYLMSPFRLSKRKYNFAMPLTFSFDMQETYNFEKKIKKISLPEIETLDYLGFKTKFGNKQNKNSFTVSYYLESSKKHFKKEDYLPLKKKLSILSKYQNLYIIAKRSK